MEDSRDEARLASSIVIRENFEDTTESYQHKTNDSKHRNKSQDSSKVGSVSKVNSGTLKRNTSNFAAENTRRPMFRVD